MSPLITEGIYVSFSITLVAAVLGLLLGIILATIRTLEIPYLNGAAKVYINVFRSLPIIMLLLATYLIVPPVLRKFGIYGDSAFICAAGMFSLFEGAYFAEIIRSGFKAIPTSQKQACQALGFTTWQSYKHILIPQAIKNTLPVAVQQTIVLFQDTSLVYIIGLTDLFGGLIKIGQVEGRIPEYIAYAALAYFAICTTLQIIANKLKTKEVL